MRHDLTKQSSNSVVKGSLAQIAKEKGQSIAESFIDADCIVIVDVSGSMSMDDAAGGKERYQVACDELAALQANMPGKIAVLAFSNDCVFCPNGIPKFLSGGTDLAGALRFAKVADVDSVRFVVISDGEPNDPADAMSIATTYRNRIDVIYVGSELNPTGREFLKKLAKASGGQAITADRVAQLSQKVQLLLAAQAG